MQAHLPSLQSLPKHLHASSTAHSRAAASTASGCQAERRRRQQPAERRRNRPRPQLAAHLMRCAVGSRRRRGWRIFQCAMLSAWSPVADRLLCLSQGPPGEQHLIGRSPGG